MKLVWPCFDSTGQNVSILDPTETWLFCEWIIDKGVGVGNATTHMKTTSMSIF